MPEVPIRSVGREPLILLSVAALLCALAAVALLLAAADSRAAAAERLEASSAERAAANIAFYDAELTYDVRLHASSGLAEYLEEYESQAALLDAAMAEATSATLTLGNSTDHLERVEHVNRTLVAIEREAIARVAEGELSRASALLNSREYGVAKREYATAIFEATNELRDSLDGQASDAQARARQRFVVAAVLGMLIVGAVVVAIVRYSRWNRTTTSQLSAADEEHAHTDMLLSNLLEHTPVAFWAVDSDRRFTRAKGQALGSLGIDEATSLGALSDDVLGAESSINQDLLRALDGETVNSRIEHGTTRLHAAYVPVTNGDHAVTGVVSIATDVSGTAEMERRLRHQAGHDALTGLANRTTFSGVLADRLVDQPTGCAILMLDLDGFKEINDTHGHHAGDLVLQVISDRLTRLTRPAELVARLGGDEFAIITDMTDRDSLGALAQRVTEACADPLPELPRHTKLTGSIGLATAAGGTDADLLRNADLALYAAKAAGRNCHAFFSGQMLRDFEAGVELRRQLDVALADDEFVCLYQPIWDLEQEAPVSVEALVRWNHPERGLLGPGDFLPTAEASGQVTQIDLAVLRTACEQVTAWRSSGLPGLGEMRVSVNFSSVDFDHSELASLVAEILAETGTEPAALVLEITETAVMTDMESTTLMLESLSDLGVGIALDDFGTGYSSLSHLQRLGVDILKVDRAFVADGTDEDAVTLAETIVGLGKQLGLRVVAEGVENEAQLATMQAAGVDLVQGFFFARPLTAEAARDFVVEAASRGAISSVALG